MIKLGNYNIEKVFIGSTPVKAIFSGDTQVWPEGTHTKDYLRFDATYGDCTISVKDNDMNRFMNLQYSFDGEEFSPFSVSVDIPEGQTVYFKADGMNEGTGYNGFVTSNQVECHGNIMSLTGDDFEDNKTLTETQQFARLFYKTNIKTAPELPATTLTEACYQSMFNSCWDLSQAPELPATTLTNNCYYNMFSVCSSLTQAPELPATTLADSCYRDMFNGCSALTQAPELPATTVYNGSYRSMFTGCTSLTQAPELPATTLADNCYFNMFNKCSSLITSPAILPATTLVNGCYSGMFGDCAAMTTTPVLPAATLTNNCYNYMFNRCTSIHYIKAMFTTAPSTTYMSNWVNGVAATGTFVKNPDATWPNVFGASAIPTGWIVETEKTTHWVEKDWGTIYPPSGYNIWVPEETALPIFYDDSEKELYLYGSSWKETTDDNGGRHTVPTEGRNIWHDGEGTTYCSEGQIHAKRVNNSWNIGYITQNVYGHNVWNDNEGHTYYSNGNIQYEFVNGAWQNKNWGSIKPEFGYNVWHDENGHTYYSDNSDQYELVNGAWQNKVWTGDVGLIGSANLIWHDNEGHTYASAIIGDLNIQCELVNGEWTQKDWGTLAPIDGRGIWHDRDGHTYYSNGTTQLEMV